MPRPAFSLFPGPLPNRERKKGESDSERSSVLAESGGGASAFNLEHTLGCSDRQVTDGETEAQRGAGTCPTEVYMSLYVVVVTDWD